MLCSLKIRATTTWALSTTLLGCRDVPGRTSNGRGLVHTASGLLPASPSPQPVYAWKSLLISDLFKNRGLPRVGRRAAREWSEAGKDSTHRISLYIKNEENTQDTQINSHPPPPTKKETQTLPHSTVPCPRAVNIPLRPPECRQSHSGDPFNLALPLLSGIRTVMGRPLQDPLVRETETRGAQPY